MDGEPVTAVCLDGPGVGVEGIADPVNQGPTLGAAGITGATGRTHKQRWTMQISGKIPFQEQVQECIQVGTGERAGDTVMTSSPSGETYRTHYGGHVVHG